MKNKFKNVTLLNIITNLCLQIVTVISGFVIPKLILGTFGSNINGLISSITQFLSYISLIEGGVTGVIMTALYEPLIKKDQVKISSVLNTSNKFFRRLSIIFIIYTLVLSIVYPLVVNLEVSYFYVMSLVWILSIGLLIQYMFSLSLKTLLNADKKIYIVSLVQIGVVIFNIIFTVLIIKFFPNVHLLKFVNGFIYLIQPIIYSFFVKKYFKIDKTVSVDDKLLKNRWNGFAINFAAFIHFSTDLTILTIFTNLETVSVYSVYALVTTGLKQLIQSVTNSFNPIIGHSYARGDLSDLNKKLDLYEFIVLYLVGSLFTIATLLITPFVMIYTSGITDADYYQPVFGVLLVLSEFLYLIKMPHLHLAYGANKYKEVSPIAFLEAIVNLIISIPLVIILGLPGVVIGTIFAMLIRLILHVSLTTKIIPNRKCSFYYKKLFLIIIASIISIVICLLFGRINYTITSWIIYGFLYFVVIFGIYIIFAGLFFKKEIKFLLLYLKK